MRKGVVAAIVIAVLAIIGVVIAMSSNNQTSSNPSTAASSTTPPANSSSQTPEAVHNVTIQNFAFSPASITIKKGTKVTWTNKDSTAHTVTADSGSGPASQTLQPGDTYSFTYNQTGTFKYHCSIHMEMTGSVTVTEGSSTTQPTSNNPAPANNSSNPYP